MCVTFHAIDHFNNFIDPLIAIRNAMEKLCSNQELSDQLCHFSLTYFSSNLTRAVIYNTVFIYKSSVIKQASSVLW